MAGTTQLVAPLKNNPLLRALRVGKMTLAALAATLELYRNGSDAEGIPVYTMLAATIGELRERARAYVAAIPNASVAESVAYVGGGALAQEELASIAVAIEAAHPDELAARLRAQTPPVIARIEDSRVLLDLRTIAPGEDGMAIAALEKAVASI